MDEWKIAHEADRLIQRVIVHGTDVITEYVAQFCDRDEDNALIDALMVTDQVAWKLCGNRNRYPSCPAVEGQDESHWCAGCHVAGEAALLSGCCGALWRERLGSGGRK